MQRLCVSKSLTHSGARGSPSRCQLRLRARRTTRRRFRARTARRVPVLAEQSYRYRAESGRARTYRRGRPGSGGSGRSVLGVRRLERARAHERSPEPRDLPNVLEGNRDGGDPLGTPPRSTRASERDRESPATLSSQPALARSRSGRARALPASTRACSGAGKREGRALPASRGARRYRIFRRRRIFSSSAHAEEGQQPTRVCSNAGSSCAMSVHIRSFAIACV